jgi:hypothetical protein
MQAIRSVSAFRQSRRYKFVSVCLPANFAVNILCFWQTWRLCGAHRRSHKIQSRQQGLNVRKCKTPLPSVSIPNFRLHTPSLVPSVGRPRASCRSELSCMCPADNIGPTQAAASIRTRPSGGHSVSLALPAIKVSGLQRTHAPAWHRNRTCMLVHNRRPRAH